GSNHLLSMDKQQVILFDGVCNLCNSAVDFTIQRDKKGRFKFASLQSDSAKELLESTGISVENAEKLDTILLLKDNILYEKSSAALRIAKQLNGLWPVMYGFIIIPPFIRDFIYDFIAKNRYKWF